MNAQIIVNNSVNKCQWWESLRTLMVAELLTPHDEEVFFPVTNSILNSTFPSLYDHLMQRDVSAFGGVSATQNSVIKL